MDEFEDNVFIIGKESSDFVKIKINGFSYPSSTDFWDGNWINSTISLRAGAFKASYDAELRNVDFYQLMNELERLHDNLKGSANFFTIEEYLEIKINGDGIGHFTADCVAIDFPGVDQSKLQFRLNFDQTEINGLIRMISDILDNYPIKETEQLRNYKSK
jgi:hypothetical protein